MAFGTGMHRVFKCTHYANRNSKGHSATLIRYHPKLLLGMASIRQHQDLSEDPFLLVEADEVNHYCPMLETPEQIAAKTIPTHPPLRPHR